MEFKLSKADWKEDSKGDFWVSFLVDKPYKFAIKEFVKNIKEVCYVASLKQYRKKRSTNANGYLWVLLEKMAQVLMTDKDSLYSEVLTRYGVFADIVVKELDVERIMSEWRAVRKLGKIFIDGEEWIQLQGYFGSSTYDTKEMARLIDGVVSECKDLDIETMTPEELQILKLDWEGENG